MEQLQHEVTPDSGAPDTHGTHDAQRPDAAGRARWCWYTRLLVAASALWALAVLLQTLLSGHWWLMLLPNLAPPGVFVVLPLVLLAGIPAARAARRRVPRRAALAVSVPALAALLGGLPWAGINWHAGGGGPVPPDAVRVFDFNTQAWGKHTDPAAFYRFLRAQHADVYLLQEYVWSDKDDANVRPIDKMADIRREFPGYHVTVRGELVTLSRFPVVAHPRVGPDRALTALADWQSVYTDGKVLRTDLLVHGQVMSFYNVHIPVQVDLRYSLLSPRFYRTLHDQDAARGAQYRGLLDDASANRHPLLISGDFNTSPAMGDISDLRAHLHDAAEDGGPLLPTSWNSRWPLGLWRLDWTFTNSRVQVHDYAIHGFAQASDHRGQLVQVSPRS